MQLLKRAGRPMQPSEVHENLIIESVQLLENNGWTPSMKDLLQTVQKIAKNSRVSFSNG